MGLFGDLFGGSGSGSNSSGSSGGTYGDMINSFFGPKPEKQPHNTTVSSGGKIFPDRQSAIDDLNKSDTSRGICGDLGNLCPKCRCYCGSRSELLQHLAEWHPYDQL